MSILIILLYFPFVSLQIFYVSPLSKCGNCDGTFEKPFPDISTALKISNDKDFLTINLLNGLIKDLKTQD